MSKFGSLVLSDSMEGTFFFLGFAFLILYIFFLSCVLENTTTTMIALVG